MKGTAAFSADEMRRVTARADHEQTQAALDCKRWARHESEADEKCKQFQEKQQQEKAQLASQQKALQAARQQAAELEKEIEASDLRRKQSLEAYQTCQEQKKRARERKDRASLDRQYAQKNKYSPMKSPKRCRLVIFSEAAS